MKLRRYWSAYRHASATLREVLAAPDRLTYADLSITPPREDEFDNLDLYRATSGGEGALARKRRDDAIRVKTLTGPLAADGAAVQSTR